MSLLQLCLAVTTGGAEISGQDSLTTDAPQPRTYDKIKKIISSYVKSDKTGPLATFDSSADLSFLESSPSNQHPNCFTNPAYNSPASFPNPEPSNGAQTVSTQEIYPTAPSYGSVVYPPPPSYGSGVYPSPPSYGSGIYPSAPSYTSGIYPATSSYGPGIYPTTSSHGPGMFPGTLFYGPGTYPTAPSYNLGVYQAVYGSGYQRFPVYKTSNHLNRVLNHRSYVRTPFYEHLRMPISDNVSHNQQMVPNQRYRF